MVYLHNVVLFGNKKLNIDTCYNTDEPWKHYTKAKKGFPGSSMVKNLPAMQEIKVWSLDSEDPLEKGQATRSSILVWEIPWTEEPGRL